MTKSNLTQRIETTILASLIYDEEYIRKVLPFIQEEYFADFKEKTIFKVISHYVEKYNGTPNVESISIDLQKVSLSEEQYRDAFEYLSELETYVPKVDSQWLLDETEKWCKDRAIYNAILDGIHIIEGKSKNQTAEAIPAILTDALSVSFDTHIGHDYIEQSEERYEFYHTKEDKIPFDLDFFNKITKGGLPPKTLNICLAGMATVMLLSLPLADNGAASTITSWADAPVAAFLIPLIGLMMAPIYPVLNSVMLSALPQHQHAPMTGLIVVFSALGGTTGSILTGFIFDAVGGQQAFYLSLIPIGALVLTLFFFKKASSSLTHEGAH